MKYGMSSLSSPPRPDVQEAVARLTELDVFRGASKSDVKQIALAGTSVRIPQGWSLIWEKTPADKAYVVLRGTASVRRRNVEFAQIHEGELIGEMAIVNHELRSATVVAATELEVLHFTKEAVEQLRATVPAFRDAVEHSAVSRVASVGD